MYMRLSAYSFCIYGAFSGSTDILALSFLSVSAFLPVARFKNIVVNYILKLFLLSFYFFLLWKIPFELCVFLARRMATDMPLFAVKTRHLFNPPHIAGRQARNSSSRNASCVGDRSLCALKSLFWSRATPRPAAISAPVFPCRTPTKGISRKRSCTTSKASAFSQSKILFFSYHFSLLFLPRAKESVSTNFCDKLLTFMPCAFAQFRRVKP